MTQKLLRFLDSKFRSVRVFGRVLIFVIAIGPLLYIAFLNYFDTRDRMTTAIVERRQALAHLGALLLREKLDHFQAVVRSVSRRRNLQNLVDQGAWTEAAEWISQILKDFPFIERFFISDAVGTLQAALPYDGGSIGKNFADREWYKEALKGREWISNIYKRSATPQFNIIAVSAPIRNAAGEFKGILVLQIPSSIFLTWAREIDAGARGFAYFTDRAGNIVAHPHFQAQDELVNFSGVPAVQRALKGEKRTEVLYNPIEQEARLASYEKVPGYDWAVVIQQPTETAFAPREQVLEQLLIVYAIVLLVELLLITALLMMVSEIRRRSAREKTFLASIGDGVMVLDRRYRIVLWNRAAEDITGWTAEEVLGRRHDEFIRFMVEAEARDYTEFIENVYKTGLVQEMQDGIVIVGKGGRITPVGDTAAPVLGDSGDIEAVIIVFRDITESRAARKKIQDTNIELEGRVLSRTQELQSMNDKLNDAMAKLQQAHMQLVQQERYRALGEMASGIAHDFNNALSPILGYSEIFIQHPVSLDNKDQAMEYLRQINMSAKDAAKIVQRLREFYKAHSDNEPFTLIDLNALAKDTVSLTQAKWKSQALKKGIVIDMKTDFEPGLPAVHGTDYQLREVLTNFIFNAVDAMPRGGEISVRTFRKDGYVALEVKDGGMGMTPEVKAKCLEPFFTTKGEHGSGLGLSIAHTILQRHSALLEIESQWDGGSVFRVLMPAAKGGREARTGLKKALPSLKPLRILFADDDRAVREVFELYLKKDGHLVDCVSDGYEAFLMFKKGQYDLVICDQGMPKMSGERLAVEIRKIAHSKPIILITGNPEIDNEARIAISLHLKKPLTIEDLTLAIAEVLPLAVLSSEKTK